MAVTTRGFQGTISDVDLATQFPQIPGVVATPTDHVITAVAGARTVSVSPGTSVAHLIKRTNDTAEQLVLAPPTSGGKWYAIAIDREWSPTNTATLVAVDTSVTTDGTIPATFAACLTQGGANPTALAWQKQSPGTAGSTAASGHHQVLGFVHVRAADTTLTIFGTRMIAGGAGYPFAENVHALAWHAQATGGGRAGKTSVGPHLLAGEQVQSIEAVGNGFGAFLLTGRVFTGAPATIGNLAAALKAQIIAYANVGRVYGESFGNARPGLAFADTQVAGGPDWAWSGADWSLFSGDADVANPVGGNIVLPGTVVDWGGGLTTLVTALSPKLRMLRLHVNIGGNGMSRGGTVATLPVGYRPVATHTFEAATFQSGSAGWDGPASQLQVGTNGVVTWNGLAGNNGSATLSANWGLFATAMFRAA